MLSLVLNFCCTTSWRVLRQSKMCPVLMVVKQVRRHQPFEMALIEDDRMVRRNQASATPHPALSNAVLPRTEKGRSSWLAAHVPHRRNHLGSKLRVAVESQESVRLLVGPCFSQLLFNPKCTGISRHIEMQDLPPVVADDKKQYRTPNVSVGTVEEIHCSNCLAMFLRNVNQRFTESRSLRSSLDPSRDTPSESSKPSLSSSP